MFWKKLKKPFFVLAPMADVTDFVFRNLFVKYGKPDVLWTEFVSADGLLSPGKENLLKDLRFSKKEKPVVAQIFSGKVENICEVGKMVENMGFDGVDINMGCPDRSIEKQGSGANLIRNRDNAISMVKELQKTVKIPVSVKTRIGYSEYEKDWIRSLLETNLSALTLHLRTRKEMSLVDAHWELMNEIVELRDEISPSTLIIGNGDVKSLEEGRVLAEKTNCDGIMVGRGAFGKPWFFSGEEKTVYQRLEILVEHTKLFEKELGFKNFNIMKKHFKAYVSGWEKAKDLRIRLMDAKNSSEVETIIQEYIKNDSI